MGLNLKHFQLLCVELSINPSCSRILLTHIAIESVQCDPKGNAYVYGLNYIEDMWKAKTNMVEMSL